LAATALYVFDPPPAGGDSVERRVEPVRKCPMFAPPVYLRAAAGYLVVAACPDAT